MKSKQTFDILTLNFDNYGRYALIAKIVEANRTKKSMRILDVGGYGGRIRDFLPQDQITTLDVFEDQSPEYIKGDATKMTFSDGSFDAVVSADVFEHIPEVLRTKFLDECMRVSNNLMIVAAPFDTEGVREADLSANEVYKSFSGKPYLWLKEHIENGLPNVDHILDWIKSNGLFHFQMSNNQLDEWKILMGNFFILENIPTVKGKVLLAEVNRDYNLTKNISEPTGPSYRQLFIVSKSVPAQPTLPAASKSKHDFKSMETTAKIVSYYLKQDGLQTGKELDSLRVEVSSLRLDLAAIIGSKRWRLAEKMSKIARIVRR